MAKQPKPARIHKQIGPHLLTGVKGVDGKWSLWSSAFPELAKQHTGCTDASACLDEFERLATAPAQGKRPSQPTLFDSEVFDPAVSAYLDERRAESPPAQRHSGTSTAAADGIAPVAGELRQRVFAWLRERGALGGTDEEGIDATGLAASTFRPRRVELVNGGRVVDSGRTRKTKSGRSATVWVCVEVKAEVA